MASKKIYLNYDQTGLDAQYNLRARWPEHATFFAAWQAKGEAARAAPGWHLDLGYGPTPAETLDILTPPVKTSGRRAPVLVYIHGGYWQGLDKRDVCFLGPAFAKAGVAFAALNYALAPMAGLDEIVRQVRAALGWLWRNAPRLGIDPARIHVAGHSAGGHLAAMLAATDWPRLGGLPEGLVRAAFSVSGVYDLAPLMLSYHQAVLKLDAGAVARNSPLHLTPRPGVKMYVAVGGDETPEFLRQQEEFVAAWRARSASVTVVPAPNLHHFDIVDRCADFAHPIGKTMLAMTRRPAA